MDTSTVTEQWEWLRSTLILQTENYHYDFDYLQSNPEAQSKYIFWNLFAAQQELAEAAVEFSWKPWAMDEPFVNRNRILMELVDACHFIGNILVGMGVSDEEWETAYRVKQNINRARASSGTYSAKKGGLGDGSD